MASPLIEYLSTFSFISSQDEALINKAFEHRTFKENELLFIPGKICRELFFICDGVLRIVVNNENGNEITHYFLKENQFCSILNSFHNKVIAIETIQAASATEVLVISRTKLFDLYQQLPYLKTLIDQITQQSLINKIAIRNEYLGLDSTARYQHFLIRQHDIAMRVSLTDIASYLGITPQSLSRIRKNIR